MTAAVKPVEIRQARAFLQENGVLSKVSPGTFARAAKELGKSFRDTLRHLSLILSGGSGAGPSPVATATKNRLDPARALGNQTPSEAMAYDAGQGDFDG